MEKLRIYLDSCCYNRPYDNQAQLRIELETKAKLSIQQQVIEDKVILVSSLILEFETNDNPYHIRRRVIKDFLGNAKEYVDNNEVVVNTAKEIRSTGIKTKDAAHVASAIYAGCDYFISTDDRLLKYKDDRIRLINPIDFIMMEGVTGE